MSDRKTSMNAYKKIVLIVSFVLSGCATNMKEKIVRNAVIAGAIGATYGDTKSEFKSQHALMYGASTALIAALASVYYYDPDKTLDSSRKTTAQLRDELDAFENQNFSGSKSQSRIYSAPALPGLEKLPDQYRKMINPGSWTLSEIDQWVDGGEGRLIHQDKMLEIRQPTLKAR